jgi:hypothetical protein
MEGRFVTQLNPGSTAHLTSHGPSTHFASIPCALSAVLRSDNLLESHVVETGIGSSRKRKMFRRQLLAVRLGQAATGYLVTARFSWLDVRARPYPGLAFFRSTRYAARRAGLTMGSAGNSNFLGGARPTEFREAREVDAMKRGKRG